MTREEQLETLQEWLTHHKGLLFKVVRAYTATQADDLFQEIVIQVWRSIPSFRKESAVTTWLYRIALNTAIKWTQKEKKYAGAQSLDGMHHLLHEKSPQTDDRLNWLYEQIHRLDEMDRSVTLLMLEGFSYKEMSAVLGISESHVGVKINRIKKQLTAQSKKEDPHGF